MLSFSKEMDRLKSTAHSLGAREGTAPEAPEFADVVVLTTPWVATGDALGQAGRVAGRKILWDCTNVLKPERIGQPRRRHFTRKDALASFRLEQCANKCSCKLSHWTI